MFKFKIAKLEDVPENLRAFYAPGSDGAFYLQVDGAVAKEKLEEFRNNNVELLKKMELYKDIDPEMYKKLKAEHDKLQEGELIKAGKVEELVAQRVKAMQEDHNAKVTELQTRYDTANRQLETLLIDNEVRSHAAKIGVAPTAIDDVLLRAKTVFKVENGQPVAKDAKGNTMYGKDGTNSLGIGDWAAGLKETAPHLFLGSQGSGANNQGNRGGPSNPKLSAVGKIAAGLASGNSPAMQE